ncbi:hypothetical protein SBRCBS47491_000665 [Sporothrix bragantina]|uniref:Major facilitator superfamily (MFS) profile domain-containing protein n=1 Tax=Sporothrix bragantina TaxID=671064 RepID=A0ABP0ASG3_9PEZI
MAELPEKPKNIENEHVDEAGFTSEIPPPTTTMSEAEQAQLYEEGDRVTLKTKLAVFSLIFMYESYLFTLIMPAAILTYINADIGPDPNYTWIAISWNLGAAVIVTIGGRLSDISGRRWFLLFGAGAGVVGSIVGATGKSINQMIVSGVIFGIGGGFQEMCFACALELVPNKYRFRTIGVMIMANHFSSFGPLIAYAWGGGQYPWKSAGVIVPLVVGFACLVALGFWEVYMPLKYPILPPHLFIQWRK